MNKMLERSHVPTRWAVICRTHGQVFLTEDAYVAQLERPDDKWRCPRCGGACEFDDENYERWEEVGVSDTEPPTP